MKNIRLTYRLVFFLCCVVILLLFRGIGWLFIRSKTKRQKRVSALVRFLSIQIRRVIGCSIKVKGLEYLKNKQNYLIVANHVSYLDIILLYNFIGRNKFISHFEIKEGNPFLNIIIKAGGVYFVERRNFNRLRSELRETSAILKQGLNLIFFPEGTSTDGLKIAPFHSVFFSTAIQAQKPILPVCINYKKIEELTWSTKNKDLICWYGDNVSFTQHLFRLLRLKSIEVELVFLSPIDSEGKNSRWLSTESQKQIQKHYRSPVVS